MLGSLLYRSSVWTVIRSEVDSIVLIATWRCGAPIAIYSIDACCVRTPPTHSLSRVTLANAGPARATIEAAMVNTAAIARIVRLNAAIVVVCPIIFSSLGVARGLLYTLTMAGEGGRASGKRTKLDLVL